MLLYDIAKAQKFGLAVEVAGRVVGIADKDSLGPGGDGLFKGLNGRQGEAFLYAGGDSFHRKACGNRETKIVGITGFYHYKFVAGVKAGHEGEEQGLRSPAGYHDFVRGKVYPELCIVAHELFPQGKQALGMGVFQGFAVYFTQGVKSLLRGWKVRLAYVQVENFGAAFLCGVSERNQFSDW